MNRRALLAGLLFLAAAVGLQAAAARQETLKPVQAPPASRPAASAPANEPRRPIQTRVLEELIRQAERPPTVLSNTPGGTANSDASLPALYVPENEEIVQERKARYVLAGNRPELHLEVASDENLPSVMPINPNGWLELMERDVAAGSSEFVVTVEISRYRGQSYATLRKVRRPLPNGNLAP